MNEILAENKRLKSEVEKLLTENMELMGVIRALRQNANEDAAALESSQRERDEARAERDILCSNKMSDPLLETTFKHLIRQRDEVRENLRILAGLVAYGLGQSGEEWSLKAMRQATAAIQNAKALEGAK